MDYYLVTVAVFFLSDAIFVLGLNMQYGLTGIINLGYIMYFAIGGYVAAVLTVGSPHGQLVQSLQETILFGANLPYPLSVIIGTLVGAALAFLIGLVALRSMREDFAALVTVAIFLVGWNVIGNANGLFDGYNGIAEIPHPLAGMLGNGNLYNWMYVLIGVAWFALAFWLVRSLTQSPFGRKLKAVRENPEAANALGKDTYRIRMAAFVIGNGLAALAGAYMVQYISAWGPLSWSFPETIVIYSALIVGGRGNNSGALLGAFIVPVLISQGVLFLPPINGNANLMSAIQWIIVGVLMVVFLWVRPAGLMPERTTQWAKWLGARHKRRRPSQAEKGEVLNG